MRRCPGRYGPPAYPRNPFKPRCVLCNHGSKIAKIGDPCEKREIPYRTRSNTTDDLMTEAQRQDMKDAGRL